VTWVRLLRKFTNEIDSVESNAINVYSIGPWNTSEILIGAFIG